MRVYVCVCVCMCVRVCARVCVHAYVCVYIGDFNGVTELERLVMFIKVRSHEFYEITKKGNVKIYGA